MRLGWAVVVFVTVLAGCTTAAPPVGRIRTPLPPDLNITAPPADAPASVAAFSGIWVGEWQRTLDSTLVVERIEGSSATVVYSWGSATRWGVDPGYLRVRGTISEDGVLTATLSGPRVTFRLAPDHESLAGEWIRFGSTSRGTFTRTTQ